MANPDSISEMIEALEVMELDFLKQLHAFETKYKSKVQSIELMHINTITHRRCANVKIYVDIKNIGG